MVEKVQSTNYKNTQYDRLSGEWRCDGTRYGSACQNGPSKKGVCPFAKEGQRKVCKPSFINGKRECTRLKEQGGKCLLGPDNHGQCGTILPPCQPKVGNLNRRKTWSRRMVILAVAFLALVIGSKHIFSWVQSDDLSVYHRNVSECTNCHEGINNSFSTWWMQGNYHLWADEPAKSYACIDCHQFNGPAMKPHNLKKAELTQLQNHLFAKTNPDSFDKNIACHQCHSEHKGLDGIDAELNNKQCQNCHIREFNGFDESHPQFTSFPEVIKRPLFDHKKHFKRFSQKKYESSRPENCQTCHLPGMSEETVMPSFETACKSCHLEKDILNIGGKQTTAISWLSVPRFDATKLKIGFWPNCKTLGVYSIEDMSPITLSYLKNYPELDEAITLLKTSATRFDKLKKATQEETTAMTTLAWGFKQLIYDLKNNKKVHWVQRDIEPQSNDKHSMINPDLLTAFAQELFPNLEKELNEKDKQPQGQCFASDDYKQIRKKWGKSKINELQGWYIQVNNKTMELGYRTQQHKDEIQKQIMDQYWQQPELFKWLTLKKKSLNCQKCHEANESEKSWVWKQKQPFFSTNFKHKPHLISSSSCQDCHRVPSSGLEQQPREPSELHASDFQTLTKKDCQSCHNQQGSTDQCTDCHKYHNDVLLMNDKNLSW